jgi:hypothetical protein
MLWLAQSLGSAEVSLWVNLFSRPARKIKVLAARWEGM